MKKVLSLIFILILCMNLTITGFASEIKSTVQTSSQDINQESIVVDTPEEYKEFNDAIRSYSGSNPIERAFETEVAGIAFLEVRLYNGMRYSFELTEHALERISARFGGDLYRVANTLFNGYIYNDLEHGGYVAVKGSDAVSFTEDYVIKTVMDDVVAWVKVLVGTWEKNTSPRNFFGF